MKGQKGNNQNLNVDIRSSIPLILLTIFLVLLAGSVCVTALAFEIRNETAAEQGIILGSSPAPEGVPVSTMPTEEPLEDAFVFFVAPVTENYTAFDPALDLVPLVFEQTEETEAAAEAIEAEAIDVETLQAEVKIDETGATEETTAAADATAPKYVLKASEDSRYPGVKLTQEDVDLLLDIIWLEARGESSDGRQAVAEVVFNRMVNKEYFPDTLYEVIYDEDVTVQFPTIFSLHMARPTGGQRVIFLKEIECALNGPYILPIDVVFFKSEAENDNIWGTIGGHTFCFPWNWNGPAETEAAEGN